MAPQVWFITGTSSGFGQELTLAALARGDKVIATARNVSKLDSLKKAGADVMQFDVTSPLPDLMKAAEAAKSIHGSIDYLINNAGYIQEGSLEELSPEETQAQFDTNVFGLLNTTRAFLPIMRAQRSAVIANISSAGGWRGVAGAGLYAASKWAVSGLSESLTYELADFGIKVCCVEPGYFRSNFLNAGNRTIAKQRFSDYEGTAARNTSDGLDAYNNNQPGDIKKGAKAMIDVLTGEDIPLRLVLGSDALEIINGKCNSTIKLLAEWKEVSMSTNHD